MNSERQDGLPGDEGRDLPAASEPSRERLVELVLAYGGDPARWPVAERHGGAGLHVVAGDDALRGAVELDQWLASMPAPPAPDPDLRRRILSAAPKPRLGLLGWVAALWTELGGVRRAGPAFALSLALGILLAPVAASEPEETDVALEAGALAEDYEDLLP
jgi:hypothetical protein